MKTRAFVLRAHLSLVFLIAGKATGENPCVVRADSQTVAEAISISMIEHDNLFAATDQYSSAILSSDWKALYGQWSPVFQHEISEDEFVKHMVSSKYDVTEYEVKRYVVEDNVARLVVRIGDSEGAPRFGIALWGKDQEGRWRCIDDGTQFIRPPRVLFGYDDLRREMIAETRESDAAKSSDEIDDSSHKEK